MSFGHISISVIRRVVFFFQISQKALDPSFKTNLDVWEWFLSEVCKSELNNTSVIDKFAFRGFQNKTG